MDRHSARFEFKMNVTNRQFVTIATETTTIVIIIDTFVPLVSGPDQNSTLGRHCKYPCSLVCIAPCRSYNDYRRLEDTSVSAFKKEAASFSQMLTLFTIVTQPCTLPAD
jgi:hypothetical protein